MNRIRILLVEDQDDIVRPLVKFLERDGFATTWFTAAEDALESLSKVGPDLVVLDLGLPGMQGLEALRVIRRQSRVPVVILTARGEEADRVVGLELGADDYVVKPFSARELAARIRAILRRDRAREQQMFVIGELELDPAARTVRAGGREVHLTVREFDLLRLLMTRSPEAVTRAELISGVWDEHWHGPTKTLDVHIAQLRRKIEPEVPRPRYIHTVRGVGYKVSDACEAA